MFKDYVNRIYSIKSNPTNKTQKAVAKSLLNNLLGRFGINLEKSVTKVVSNNTFEKYMVMYKITSYKNISEDKTLISYIPKLDHNIIKSNNLNFIKLANKYKDHELQTFKSTSVIISAAVTSYARIYMSKNKLDLLNKGAKVFYTDTDSLVTDIPLSANLVGKELGQFKLEHLIDRGIFISNKTSCTWDNGGNFKNIAKGIKASFLSYFDYIKLLNGKNITHAIKKESKIDWAVIIQISLKLKLFT